MIVFSSGVSFKQLFQWFPDEYHGDEQGGGVNGHYYHVFDTVSESDRLPELNSEPLVQPLYYKLPEDAQV